jgi:putative molybdopterin biosynthesis protein
MPFQYLTNIPLADARQQYLDALISAGMAPLIEVIPTESANHRVTSSAVYAQISAPHYNACAMDGIALSAALTQFASETHPVTLEPEAFRWVNTGDPLPEGSDCVVMVEDVIEVEGKVRLYAAAVPWQNVRQIGEDISAGDMIVTSNTELTPPALGAMLAAGVLQVAVYRQPLVGLIPSGNELISPRENPGPGDIIEFNSTIFSGLLQDLGCQVKVFPIVPDQPMQIEAALQAALADCDMVILNAGSSAGAKDFALDAIRKVGTVLLHGVAIKPGKPAILASAQVGHKVIPVVGLPGYPVSGILVLDQLLKPVISRLTGRLYPDAPFIQASISRRLTSTLKYLEFVRARVGEVNGRLVAVPLNRGAGVVSSFVKADGIIHIPQNTEGYEAGDLVDVQLIRSLDDIRRTLVITGSHDPLLDEITDILKRRWPETQVASSHVGSMGGIMAIRRGEAHMGGIHLLDEETGEYNLAYVRRYFPQGGVVLLRCVQRTQGLMIQPGNPLGIQGIADLPRTRYVNRQKGSGTRILIDFLTSRQGIDTSTVLGFDREEMTHTAVAAAIAAGSADAGMGILAAARIYGLDFIPVAEEQYDLLVAESALQMESVQRLIEVLKGPELAERLQRMGGYTLEQPGEVIKWN